MDTEIREGLGPAHEPGDAEKDGQIATDMAAAKTDVDAGAEEPGAPEPETDTAEAGSEADTAEPNASDAGADAAETAEAAAQDATAVRPTPDLTETQVVEKRAPQGRVAQVAAKARGFLASHKRPVAVVAALVVALVALLTVAGIHAGSVPADDVVAADARTRVGAPDYSGGKWGDDAELEVGDVKVLSVRKTQSAIDPSAEQFGASGYAQAEVSVTFENGSVRATKTATLGYAKVAGMWTAIGGEMDANAAFEAREGVDEDAVKANSAALLERAEQSLHASGDGSGASDDGVGEKSLVGIYAGGDFEVVSSDFDTESQTDSLVLSCKKAGIYDEYSCQIGVKFAFRPVNGLWEIVETDVPADAKTRSFAPLAGTWTGTFQSQETDGAKCLAATNAPLTVEITGQEGSSDAQGTGARLVGTVSGVAHFHANPQKDSQSCEGDADISGAALTAELVPGGSNGSDLAFSAQLPDQAGGNVSVTLQFGTATDPSSVLAVVQTTYVHEGSFLFFPTSETLTYRDTYVMRRQQ